MGEQMIEANVMILHHFILLLAQFSHKAYFDMFGLLSYINMNRSGAYSYTMRYSSFEYVFRTRSWVEILA